MTNPYLASLSKLAKNLPLLIEKDEDDIYHLIATEIRKATRAEVSAVFIEREGQLIRKAINGLPSSFFPNETYPKLASIVGHAFESEEAIRSNNVTRDIPYVFPHYVSEYKQAIPSKKFEHVIAFRFYSQSFKRPFGVIRIVNKTSFFSKGVLDSTGFSENDFCFLETVSQMLADTIELQWRFQRNHALLEISHLVEGNQNESQTYNKIVKHAKNAFRVDQAGIAIFAPDKKLAYVAAQSPRNPSFDNDEEPAPIFSIDGYKAVDFLIENKKPIAIDDAQNDVATSSAHEIIKRQKIQSFLLVPLIVNGKVVGSLGLDSIKYRRKFYQDELDFAELLAKNITLAVEKAHAVIETRQNERSLLAVRMHDIKDEFFGFIKLPLSTAVKLYDRNEPAKAWDLIRQIDKYTVTFYDQLDNVMRHLREDLLVEEGLGSALRRYVDTSPRKCVTLLSNYSDRLPIQLEYKLHELAQELIINALNHGVESKPDGKVEVVLKQTIQRKENSAKALNEVILHVSDNGAPWNEDVLKKFRFNQLTSTGSQRFNLFENKVRMGYGLGNRVKVNRRFPKSHRDKTIGILVSYLMED